MQQFNRCDCHVPENCHMRKEVEVLKDHTHLLTMGVDVDFRVGDVHAIKQDIAFGRNFQQVERAQQGRFSAAGRADDDQHLTFMYDAVDPIQCLYFTFVIMLFQPIDLNQYVTVHFCAASSPDSLPARTELRPGSGKPLQLSTMV